MNINFLRYPKKSHRKAIKFPCNSILLAEFMGIEFGDGGIGNPWQVVITLNNKRVSLIIILGSVSQVIPEIFWVPWQIFFKNLRLSRILLTKEDEFTCTEKIL